jgi:tetratricopeptide (TPR) repeat protein
LFVWWNYHFRQGREAVERWHNADAFTHLSACRSVRPNHAETILLAARLARRVGAWAEAEALLNQYAAEHGKDEAWAFEWLLHGAARGEGDAHSAALRARVAAGGVQARLTREALALGFLDRYRLAEAIALLNEWLRDSPDDPIALLLLGKVTEILNGQEQAIQLYQRAIELDPDLLDARLRLAAVLVDRRRGEEAAEQLAILRARLPSNTNVHVLWAQALRLIGRGEEARRVLDELLAANPDDPRVLAECGGLALLDPDGAPRAESLLARAVRLDPGDVPTRNQYALALGQNGKAAEAAEQYKLIHQYQADSDRFRELLNGPLRTSPNDPAVYHEIGLIALRAGQPADALRWFRRSLEADPDYLPAHRTLSALYKDLDNPAMAAHHRAIAQHIAARRAKP